MVDVVSVARLMEPCNGDGDRRARTDPAEGAKALGLGISRFGPAQEVIDEIDIPSRALRNDEAILDRMGLGQDGADKIEELHPKIREDREGMDDRFRAPVPKHRIARDVRIRPVRGGIGVQRSDQRYLMPCARCRMSARKIKGIGAGLPQPGGCDRDVNRNSSLQCALDSLVNSSSTEFRYSGLSRFNSSNAWCQISSLR